jgi:KipI family sensor histidine kinase inhibitor
VADGASSGRTASPFQVPRIEPFGDSAVLVVLGDAPDIAVNRRVHRLAAAVDDARRGGLLPAHGFADGERMSAFGRPVAGFASLLVPFDPAIVALEAVDAFVRSVLDGLPDEGATRPPGASPTPEPIEIPVRYGGDDGPDLIEVADLNGLRPSDVVELHAAGTYEVLFLGFGSGFGYLGLLPDEIVTPRRSTPRSRVPAGSVGIAGRQTCVYPFATPGGWNLIGRTSTTMWGPTRRDPALLAPGMRVRFVPARSS